MITLGQLRGLIRNDEAMLDHYVQWQAAINEGEVAPVDLSVRIAQTIRRLHARRTVLANSTLPAAPASSEQSETRAPKVTSGDAQPASL